MPHWLFQGRRGPVGDVDGVHAHDSASRGLNKACSAVAPFVEADYGAGCDDDAAAAAKDDFDWSAMTVVIEVPYAAVARHQSVGALLMVASQEMIEVAPHWLSHGPQNTVAVRRSHDHAFQPQPLRLPV